MMVWEALKLLLLKSTDSLTWAHKLLKVGKAWHLCLHFVSVFALSLSLYSHFTITLDSKKDKTDTFMTMNWSHLELPPSQWGPLSQESSQKRTRLLTPGDNFPELDQTTRPLASPRLTAPPVKTNQTTPWTELFNYAHLLSPALSSLVYLNL
jgi:hypothetical protein